MHDLNNFFYNSIENIIVSGEQILSASIENERRCKEAMIVLRQYMNKNAGSDRDNLIHFCQVDGRKGIHNILMRLFNCYTGRIKTCIDAFVDVERATFAKDIAESFIWEHFNSLEYLISRIPDKDLKKQKARL